MIASDLKGNHTYCKPKCRSKCQPFMLFHLHHIHCRMWAEEKQVSVPPYVCVSLRFIISQHRTFLLPSHRNTSAAFRRHHLQWWCRFFPFFFWQSDNTQTEIHFWIMAPLCLFCSQPVCFAVCKVSRQWVTQLFLCNDAECDSEMSGITVFLRRGWCYSNWGLVTAGNHPITECVWMVSQMWDGAVEKHHV